jgi:hypothetical protein
MNNWISRKLICNEVFKNIQLNQYDGTSYECGCCPHPKEPHLQFHLCEYHNGYNDGFNESKTNLLEENENNLAATKKEILELQRQIEDADKYEKALYKVIDDWHDKYIDVLIYFGAISEKPLTIQEVGGCTCQCFDPETKLCTYGNAECNYHASAERQPWNHRIPWNCKTYYDGCNCEDGPYIWKDNSKQDWDKITL